MWSVEIWATRNPYVENDEKGNTRTKKLALSNLRHCSLQDSGFRSLQLNFEKSLLWQTQGLYKSSSSLPINFCQNAWLTCFQLSILKYNTEQNQRERPLNPFHLTYINKVYYIAMKAIYSFIRSERNHIRMYNILYT